MKPIHIDLLLTAITPISHHDPAQNDGSNTLTFNRQKQHVERAAVGGSLDQAAIDAFCTANPVPLALVDLLQPLKFSEFIAVTLTRVMIDLYNSMDGTGLFSGMDRYTMLENRLRSAAVRSSTLTRLWAQATKDLQLPIHPGRADTGVVQFFALPLGVQESVIATLVDEYRSIVTIARVWSQTVKQADPTYAAKTGQPALSGLDALEVLRFNADDIRENHRHVVMDVPAVSANSIRHQAVRAPGWNHLIGALGLDVATQVPISVEAIFANGGNIRAGAKQPPAAFGLAQTIREVWPLLDLIGGVTDSFDLGESKLSVAAWLVCRENAAALGQYDLPGLEISAYDMLDDVTMTRQATERGAGQMIWNFETLAAGTQFLTRLTLAPFTRSKTIGALGAALDCYLASSVIAGQSARGLGRVTGVLLSTPVPLDDARAEYEDYLAQFGDYLRAQLADGTLGSGAVVLS